MEWSSSAISSSLPSQWRYVAEGAANLILAYSPPADGTVCEHLTGKCLRLAKRATGSPATGSNPAGSTHITPGEFTRRFLAAVIPSELLLAFQHVPLDPSHRTWLQDIAALVHAMRPPAKRAHSEIDLAARHAVIMDNLTGPPTGADDAPLMLSFEIKPKWASLPRAPEWLHPTSIETKTQFCRTCVFRAVRALEHPSTPTDPASSPAQQQQQQKQQKEQSLNAYYTSPQRFCALQLFSTGHPAHLRQALTRLLAEWQFRPRSSPSPDPVHEPAPGPEGASPLGPTHAHNNLKVFCNGVLLDPVSVQIDPQMVEVLAVTLERSGVLVRLADLQRRLDPLDIEGLFAELDGAPGGGDAVLAEPVTVAELDAIIPLLAESIAPTECARAFARLPLRTKAVIRPRLPAAHSLVKIIDLDLKPITRLHKYLANDRATFSRFTNLLLSSHSSQHTSCVQLTSSPPVLPS
ncbi:hypothetical protein PCANC_07118 [Puccinia coronata f. sp. avenae]|uniref:Inositol-pentakisphosphate 2-kinase n=1 Tax=Puccinia coronata f. sp. avenae TaxID=200324 RepID=A0A2N5VIP3_9BASI|nr:hypothetical protein PCANC_07118 [Puccinia coronata f. sp. avenae]